MNIGILYFAVRIPNLNLTGLKYWCMALTDVGQLFFSCVVVLLDKTEKK